MSAAWPEGGVDTYEPSWVPTKYAQELAGTGCSVPETTYVLYAPVPHTTPALDSNGPIGREGGGRRERVASHGR